MTGAGIGDITSPIGEIIMNGYDNAPTVANGVHLRLKARAFIFAGTNGLRSVFVSVDLGLNSQIMKQMVIANLQTQLGSDASWYTMENIMISATHTHAGPAGYNDDFLYEALTLGVVSNARQVIAAGVTTAIVQAHHNLAASSVGLSVGTLVGSAINRSNKSYANNPADERALYSENVDTTMTELLLRGNDGTLKSVINWFAVHGTSMNNNNTYVSGDNKGYASYMWELQKGPGFVAAFAQTNAGDATPNLIPPTCANTGLPCDGSAKDCNGLVSMCQGHGPGWDVGQDDFYSTEVIGGMQLKAAQSLASSPTVQNNIAGEIRFKHALVDFTNIRVTLPDGNNATTCPPAMGFSFAAATTDGVSNDLFYQGDNTVDASAQWYWHALGDIISLSPLSDAQKACHSPKQVLLNTGYSNVPNAWQPHVLPLQMFLIGRKFAIIGFPAEITTMAGRRLRNTTLAALIQAGAVDADATIVIAALSNTYASYTTTYEEYQIQRYEGASTAYGPHQLRAFQKLYAQMAASFTNASMNVPSLAASPIPSSELSLLPGVVLDVPHITHEFGSVLVQPSGSYSVGSTVSALFQCAHPRTGTGHVDLASGAPTFMTVEVQNATTGQWTTFLTDAGWDTKYKWTRTAGTAESTCQLDWKVGKTVSTATGSYRLRIFFSAVTIAGVQNFTGATNAFVVG
ncbi:Neutral/alkaline nonlysosomal ceramidase [Chytriomyces sp. MP71]|nr:Neutral/alkaline nonlysosomal ceramidase [Chytriomyces sp. MP71]